MGDSKVIDLIINNPSISFGVMCILLGGNIGGFLSTIIKSFTKKKEEGNEEYALFSQFSKLEKRVANIEAEYIREIDFEKELEKVTDKIMDRFESLEIRIEEKLESLKKSIDERNQNQNARIDWNADRISKLEDARISGI